jgi:uncharacterized membrane protein HdeD (DUF308 family)
MRESISIWWFAGLLLLVYGVIITAAGLWELVHPLANPPVLSRLHASIWWGALLTLAGLLYSIRYFPRKLKDSSNSKDK